MFDIDWTSIGKTILWMAIYFLGYIQGIDFGKEEAMEAIKKKKEASEKADIREQQKENENPQQKFRVRTSWDW